MATCTIPANFFEEQWTQNHPQYLSGFSRALFPTSFLEMAVDSQRDSSTLMLAGAEILVVLASLLPHLGFLKIAEVVEVK